MKKFLIYICIALFVLVGSYTVITPDSAHAACITGNALDCLALVSNSILSIIGKAVWLAGILLNYSIKWTLNLSTFVKTVPAIALAWKTVRDFSTMVFIFLILYQAISIILGLQGLGTKKLLVNIVIAGLLINFSLFFTNLIIDASNVVALQFYNAITPDSAAYDNGLSNIFMQRLKIQTTFDHNTAQLAGGAPTAITPQNNLIIIVMGSILMLIAAFTFFVAALLFMIRSATLILLMALSPFAFLGDVLPKTGQLASGLASKWWSTLISQCTFAPTFLLLTYIGMKIMASPQFNDTINSSGKGATFSQAFTGSGGGSIAVVFNFVIVIMFFLFALIAAKSSGTWGAGKIIGWGDSLRKWGQGAVVGGTVRNTFGRAASKIADSDWMKDRATGLIGSNALKGLRGVASGYDKRLSEQVKSRTEFAESLGESKELPKLKAVLAGQKADLAKAKKAGASQNVISQLESNVSASQTKIDGLSNKRQLAYAQYVNKRHADTLWTKVARKNKVGAAAIEIKVLEDKNTDLQKKVDDNKGEFGKLESKERAWDNGNGTGPALSAAEKARFKELGDAKDKNEKTIRDNKLKIADLKAIT